MRSCSTSSGYDGETIRAVFRGSLTRLRPLSRLRPLDSRLHLDDNRPT
jgi:hypothetical protein